ncbi:PIN domain-containing protein [Desulfovibrio inopinatus]|uniref:PIN domain-containing protein n=1 Tax=Desulfovibrio inopinatus TaxID=102109 RepID=UPI0003FE0D56|nr:PIN domain-containing protein [Desulfovibrio inopinatus]
MLLLVSDANILIDMEEGGLLVSMFSLKCQFIIPNILFVEELSEFHAYFLDYGLEQRALSAESMLVAMEMMQSYRHPSRNDLFALALAKQENCSLLTGDKHLEMEAEEEGVSVHCRIWLVEEMVKSEKITISIAKAAYEKMEQSGRRLPWKKAIERLED